MKIVVLCFLFIKMNACCAQDPTFSQFFSSPLNVNPALTANINADWRAILNYRSQWMGAQSPYTTGTISYDSKIFQNKNKFVSEDNYFGLGGMLMFDRALGGVAKSTFASLNLSYNIKIIDGYNKHRWGLGFGASYGRRSIDYSQLSFENQYTGSGFNTSLPTGESALSNMKPFVSINTGLTYSITNDKSNFDFGVAAFHVNKPAQTFLQDVNQHLEIRKVVHANFETYLNENTVANTNAIYQQQGTAKYLSAGAGLGFYSGEDRSTLINSGLWFRAKNGFVPYIGLAINNLQFGLSYDITTSKLNEAAVKPASIELSIILRGSREVSKSIPCPWK